MIFTGGQGYGGLGCRGARDLHTPHIDKLAAEGVRFTDFYAAAICSPSRAALLTGLLSRSRGYPRRAAVERENGIDAREKLLPEILKERGYATAIIGKWRHRAGSRVTVGVHCRAGSPFRVSARILQNLQTASFQPLACDFELREAPLFRRLPEVAIASYARGASYALEYETRRNRMATELQIAASRTNGARSQGPISIDGKARSSQNAVRHGLTAKTVVLNNEDPAQFKILCENLANDYQPRTEYEHELVSQLAGARWKLRRCNIIEKGIFDKAVDEIRPKIQAEYEGADEEMFTIFALEQAIDSPQLKSLRRYMTQILREERHASSQLEKIRRERPPQPPAAVSASEIAAKRNEPGEKEPENGASRNEPGKSGLTGQIGPVPVDQERR